MEQSRYALFISFLVLFFIRGRHAQSPCPEYFEYKSDENGVYGLVHIFPKERVSSITTRINFTVAARLPSGYLGRLDSLGNDLALIQQFNRGQSIDYRLDFPVTSPLPRITSISVNDDVVCVGPGHTAGINNVNYVTKVGLQHTLYLKNPGSGQTVPVFENNQNFPGFVFESNNVNYPWNTNDKPVVVINDSQNFDFDRFRPTKPFDFNAIFTRPQAPKEPVTPEPTMPTRPPVQQQTPPSAPQSFNECGVNGNIDSVPLVYNGLSYDRGEWPWVVAIFRRKDIGLSYVCSGTLISDRHVITAAHCMHSKTSRTSINDIVVKAGVYNILDWGDDDITVSRVLSSATIHESYNSSTLANDILLLTFTRAVEFNVYIKAACLWGGNPDLNLIAGTVGVVTGWGVSEIGPAGSGEPRMVRMPIVRTSTCRASKPEFFKLTSSTTLCAGDRNGAGPCLGDSGGGLYLRDNGRWKLRGIVSLSLVAQTGDRACNLNDFVVFTDAAQYLPWIHSNMKT